MDTVTKTIMKVEVITLPVSNADRTRDFFANLGWSIDHDHRVDENVRFIQMTPPGSACSFAFGEGLTDNTPGTSNNVMLVVDDTRALIDELRKKGVDATDADEQVWGTFTTMTDPDGNLFTFQELPDYSQVHFD
jgi:catechol 2,3-dioxygenase-like lactoylglutathione lyase family enzyme